MLSTGKENTNAPYKRTFCTNRHWYNRAHITKWSNTIIRNLIIIKIQGKTTSIRAHIQFKDNYKKQKKTLAKKQE